MKQVQSSLSTLSSLFIHTLMADKRSESSKREYGESRDLEEEVRTVLGERKYWRAGEEKRVYPCAVKYLARLRILISTCSAATLV